ncbi:MAG: alginate export family protein [Pseudomonadales bacterium]|nr:alginate export family protein [Pseudomonadales bacterium]
MNKVLLTFTASVLLCQSAIAENTISEAFSLGKTHADFRLRYEGVQQDNALKDANALTLRSRLGYTTADFNGFSAMMEFEDSRSVLGVDDYSVPPTGFHTPGGVPEYSVIADPATTELDQAYLRYKSDQVDLKGGRQVIVLDTARFVGDVGWRQDRQTFDGLKAVFAPLENMELTYAYIAQRNRIFAQEKDVDSSDHLLNGSYNTDFGKAVAYAYLLEDEGNPVSNGLDTYGLSFKGGTKIDRAKLLYAAEFAFQSSEVGTADYDANYMLLEIGALANGITTKIGYEVLGSDGGAYGFSTPLATLHKFNGWADQFLGTPKQGLVDIYISAGGKLGGGKWAVIYHDFAADESTATVDDLGSEFDLLYARKFGKHYNGGIKYAHYSAGDVAAGKVDTDKLWVWAGVSF